MPQNVSSVVQKKAVGFSGFRTEARSTSGALNQQPRRIRRAEHHNAIRVRRIEAASQNVDVRQKLERRLRCSEKIRRDEFPLEPGDDFSPFGRRRITGHDRTLLAGKRLDFFRNMLAMIHRSGENQHGLAVTGQFHNLPAGGCHQRIVVHCGGDLVADELAATDVQVCQIRLRAARPGNQRGKIPLLNHFLESRFIADLVQDVLRFADEPALEPEGRCRQPDHPDVWIDDLHIGQKGSVHAVPFAADQVCFIHDDKVKGVQLAGLVVHALNPGDNDLLRGVAAPESGGIDADLQFRTEFADLVGILFQQFLDMGKDQHASIPFFHGILCDLSENQTFARIVMDYKVSINIQMVTVQFKSIKIILR